MALQSHTPASGKRCKAVYTGSIPVVASTKCLQIGGFSASANSYKTQVCPRSAQKPFTVNAPRARFAGDLHTRRSASLESSTKKPFTGALRVRRTSAVARSLSDASAPSSHVPHQLVEDHRRMTLTSHIRSHAGAAESRSPRRRGHRRPSRLRLPITFEAVARQPRSRATQISVPISRSNAPAPRRSRSGHQVGTLTWIL
jgi:hypothetical protein